LEKGSNGWVILTKGIKNIKMNEGFGKLVYLGVVIWGIFSLVSYMPILWICIYWGCIKKNRPWEKQLKY
jgi:hypothetical protein